MTEQIKELLAVLVRARKKLSYVEHDDKGNDAYCLICEAESIAKELSKDG